MNHKMASESSKQPHELPVLAISQTETKVEKTNEETTENPRDINKPENDLQTLKPLSDFKEDEHVSCPYNAAHQILISRMQTHLTKCRENFKNSRKRVCPYNEAHMINELEWSLHCELCPERILNDGAKKTVLEEPEETSDTRSLVPVENRDVIMAPSENWDEVESPTYDPNVKLENVGTILVQPRGGKKHEREEFRAQRRRLYHQTLHNSNALETISECGSGRYEPDGKIGAHAIPQHAKEHKMANSFSTAKAANTCKPHWETRKFVAQNDQQGDYDNDDRQSNYSNYHSARSTTSSPKKTSDTWGTNYNSRPSYRESEQDSSYKDRKSSRGFSDKHEHRQEDRGYNDNHGPRKMYEEDYAKEKYNPPKRAQNTTYTQYRNNVGRRDIRIEVNDEREEHIMDENGSWVVVRSKKSRPQKEKRQNYQSTNPMKSERGFCEDENWGDEYTPVARKENCFYTQDTPPYSPSPMLVDNDLNDFARPRVAQSKYRYPASVEMTSGPINQDFNFDTNNEKNNFSAEFCQKYNTAPPNFEPVSNSQCRSTTPSTFASIHKNVDNASLPWSTASSSVVLRSPSVNLRRPAAIMTPPKSPTETYYHPCPQTSVSSVGQYSKQSGPGMGYESGGNKKDMYENPFFDKRSDGYYESPHTMPIIKQEVKDNTELYVAPHLRGNTVGRARGERFSAPPGFQGLQPVTPKRADFFYTCAKERRPEIQTSANVFQSTDGFRREYDDLFESTEMSIGRGSRRKAH